MGVVIAVILLGVLAAVVLVGASKRRDRSATGLSREARRRDTANPALSGGGETAPTGREVEATAAAARTEIVPVPSVPPEPFVAPDPIAVGVSRRQFFNRSLVGMMGFGLSGFGGASLAFLWPQGVSGFGAKIKVGNLVELAGMTAGVEGGFDSGILALYQKCPHLGCRVPNCVSSQWFECPCHGSKYNQVGEKRGGPAPRGMDRFAMSVIDGVLTVDTGTIVQGPPIGTNTTGQEAEGPNCIGQAAGH